MFLLNAILSLLIGIPAVAGWIRYSKIQPAFYPFIWWLSSGFVTEILSIWASYRFFNNTAVNNLYTMVAPVFIVYFLHQWNRRFIPSSVCILVTLVSLSVFASLWMYYNTLERFYSPLVIANATMVVLASAHFFYRHLSNSICYIQRDAPSLICLGIIVLHIFIIFTECFLIWAQSTNAIYAFCIPVIYSVINVIVNVIFLIAVLCTPLQIQYFLRRSSQL